MGSTRAVGASTAEQEAIAQARADYYYSSRWSGPAGSGAAAALWATLAASTSQPPDALAIWLVAILTSVGMQIAAFSIFRNIAATDGIPKVAHLAHMAIGIGFGTTLWLDLDATRDPEFRWITLACLFAMSAGVASGFSGVNRLGQLLAIPMWFGATTALVATQQLVAAIACALFAIITLRDMTDNGARWTELLELRHASARLADRHRWDANHDALTGLLNRAGFIEQLRGGSDETRGDHSVMFIDLDHFKEVNDRFGHATGDDVLAEAAERISGVVRPNDIVGRLGGDEFCVILDGDVDEHDADGLGDRIVAELERPIPVTPTEDVFVSASVGIARMTAGDTAERVLTRADHAMYRAKRTGRRRVVRFDDQLENELRRRSGLETALRQTIQNGGLSVAAQPVFHIDTGEVHAVELLARWNLPEGGSIPPSVFIPLAEEIGLIGDLTSSMLQAAGAAARDWTNDPRLQNARISVNVSAVEFVRGRLVDRVASTITEFGFPPGRLLLELTESQQLANEDIDIGQFEAMRAMGARFAIDDFGAGYSSLDQLLSLPIDVVKLDLSLIGNLGVDPRQTALLRNIHGLASVIGTTVIVEGVQTQAQLDELHVIGATHAQGFYLCQPVPIEHLSEHLEMLSDLRVSEGTPVGARRGGWPSASSTS